MYLIVQLFDLILNIKNFCMIVNRVIEFEHSNSTVQIPELIENFSFIYRLKSASNDDEITVDSDTI